MTMPDRYGSFSGLIEPILDVLNLSPLRGLPLDGPDPRCPVQVVQRLRLGQSGATRIRPPYCQSGFGIKRDGL
jgi:hypothetical protein